MKSFDTITTPAQALAEFPSVDALNRELKRTASARCRYGKDFRKKDLVPAIEAYEEVLRAAKAQLAPAKKGVPSLTADDIAGLDYDETCAAIRSIQSKKSNTKYLSAKPGDNDAYRAACEVEAMLKAHRDELDPTRGGTVKKSVLAALIERAEAGEDILDELKSLL